MNEVLNQLSQRFKPKVSVIKNALTFSMRKSIWNSKRAKKIHRDSCKYLFCLLVVSNTLSQ